MSLCTTRSSSILARPVAVWLRHVSASAFALGTTIPRVRESQAECRRFGLARLELGTHLREFSLDLLIGFSGVGRFLQSALSLLEGVIARE
jgi:hypothetical protein